MRAFAILIGLAVLCQAEAQEYWHFGKPMRMYGVYRRVYGNPNQLFANGNWQQETSSSERFNANSKNSYSDEARANIEVITQEVTFNGKNCTRFVSSWDDLPVREDALRKMNADQRLQAILAVTHRKYETVVDPDGNPRLVYSDNKDGRGQIKVWAKFNKDDIEVTVENKQGTKKITINPAYGVEAFRNPIPDVIKGAGKDREPKRYCTIDPKTGGILDYMVQYKSKFKGKIDRTEYSGCVIELTGAIGKRFLLVSDKGELLQVDYGNDHDYINAVFTKDLSKP
jgi:hypothetical protein